MIREIQFFPLSTRVDPWGGAVSNEVRDNPGTGRNSLRMSGCRHVLVLVHGFNNSQEKAEESYALFYSRLEGHFRRSNLAPDAVAFFHWPGNYAMARFDAAAWYHVDIERARESAKLFAEYLSGFDDPESLRVTLVGHSLGCRLILLTLKNLRGPRIPKIDIVSLMAPAIPVDLLSQLNDPDLEDDDLSLTVQAPRRILKFFSKRDWALSAGFPLGQQAAYQRKIEKRHYREAVGLNGSPASVGIPFETNNGHSDYWGDVRTTNELGRLLDPAFHSLPQPHRISGWVMESAQPIESHRISDRT